jgi:subtilase family serine protease
MTNLRSLPLCVFASVLFAAASASTAAIAQQPANQTRPEVRIVNPIDESQLVALKGNVVPAAIAKNDRGPVSALLPMADLVLVLSRSPEQQAAFDAFVKSQYDSSSPNFHQWLTPDQIGTQFGPAQADIATITGWLTSQGFAVSHTAKDRMTITFSGTAGQVESAFHTSIHNLSVNGVAHIANMTNPSIPAALAPVVAGIKQLHDFHPRPLHKVGSVVQFSHELGKWQRVEGSTMNRTSLSAQTAKTTAPATTAKPRPLFTDPATSDTLVEEDVSPNDFATIYNVQPLWTNNITGTGQTIAIVGTSDICLGQSGTPCNSINDVSSYKSAFALPAGVAPVQVNGNSYPPGVCTSSSSTVACGVGDLEENTLDVEVSGAVAPGAQVVLVASGYNNQTNPTNDPIFDSSQYIEENSTVSGSPVYGAHVINVSYGECELFQGTSGNVTYYNLWQSAAAEGIAVFAATGDAGSPSCDQDEDANGNPYSAQFGLAVSGVASTPFNTAVGGTDFSWCQPEIVASGNNGVTENCPTTTGSSYWNSSNTTNNASAKGYVPEIPWNDTCENPIWAAYIESIAKFLEISGVTIPATAEESCNYVENNWYDIYESGDPVLAGLVDTVGGSGGASNCVVNDADTDPNNPTCTTGTSSVSIGSSSVSLSNDGWPVPSWQTGATGTSGLTSRSIPDVSFFAGNGSLDSATLICLDIVAGATCSSSSVASSALEIGGTSVASPEMAGVMALINQKSGGPQGSPNKQLYQLAAKQTYSECSAETVTSSSSCYFQSIDTGTISMPCSLGAAGGEGGAIYAGDGNWEVSPEYEYTGNVSPNCTALNSGDVIGTLVSSGTTPAYNATAGYNLATGLGSLNVANVVNGWTSDAGTHTATMTVTLNPTGTVSSADTLTISVAVTGADGTPTGSVAVSGGGFSGNGTLNGSGDTTITVPAGTLAPGSDTLTVTYSGDTTYASTSKTETVTVAAALPTVTVSAPASGNINNALTPVTVTVSGPLGSTTPTGTVTLAQTGGTYSSPAETLSSSGTYTFTIPAGSLTSGTDTLTATYSGNTTYTTATGSTTVVMVGTVLIAPTAVTVTPSPTAIDTSQGLNLAVRVTGTGATPTGTITLTSPSISSVQPATLDASGSAPLAIPAGALPAGTDSITVTYSGDATYKSATGTTTVTVTASTFALSATTPTAVSPGSSTTSSITGTKSTTDYTGTVTLNSCSLTSSSVTSPTSPPTCTVSGTITYASGTATGSGTATITTTSNSAMLDTRPGGKGWLGAGGGAVLAFLVFLGVPARRRSWRALMGMIVLLASLGGLAACGGGSVSTTINTQTSAGTYTFTVTGQGNDSASTQGTGTFTVTVN